jgi:septum formation protein
MTPLAEVDLVLASTSRYRRELLERITSRIRQIAPDVDEMSLPHETPCALAARLATAKAQAVAARCAGAVVIGSDQVADLSGKILGKPGTAEHARAQLAACSGREVVFHTALCVLDARNAPGRSFTATDTTHVHFRTLDAAEIARYIERESPLDCAGSFKSEGLGVGLFQRVSCEDPTALIGLPLIALCRLLREAGIATI